MCTGFTTDNVCIYEHNLEKNYFLIKRKQGVNNCFRPLISSVFTTVASRLKSEQKGKEK